MIRTDVTVKTLIHKLKKMDSDAIVVMYTDPEGNGVSPLDDIYEGIFNKKNREFGSDKLTKEDAAAGYTEEDLIIGTKAVLLIPR